ncbi:hypothetical protein C8J57DRAFT_1249218 [Mycena rebaudengoi]|nr:hypothetical protein C8J57DRAFT_1249218 [Mycena rebaudengoi]
MVLCVCELHYFLDNAHWHQPFAHSRPGVDFVRPVHRHHPTAYVVPGSPPSVFYITALRAAANHCHSVEQMDTGPFFLHYYIQSYGLQTQLPFNGSMKGAIRLKTRLWEYIRCSFVDKTVGESDAQFHFKHGHNVTDHLSVVARIFCDGFPARITQDEEPDVFTLTRQHMIYQCPPLFAGFSLQILASLPTETGHPTKTIHPELGDWKFQAWYKGTTTSTLKLSFGNVGIYVNRRIGGTFNTDGISSQLV